MTWAAFVIVAFSFSRSVAALSISGPGKKSQHGKSAHKLAKAKKLPKVSEESQACFSALKLGVSPGSTLGQTTEASVDDCMARCIALDDCYAMSFRMSDGLCNAINRTYEARFEASDERVLANKLTGCNQAYGTPKGSKIKQEDSPG